MSLLKATNSRIATAPFQTENWSFISTAAAAHKGSKNATRNNRRIFRRMRSEDLESQEVFSRKILEQSCPLKTLNSKSRVTLIALSKMFTNRRSSAEIQTQDGRLGSVNASNNLCNLLILLVG